MTVFALAPIVHAALAPTIAQTCCDGRSGSTFEKNPRRCQVQACRVHSRDIRAGIGRRLHPDVSPLPSHGLGTTPAPSASFSRVSALSSGPRCRRERALTRQPFLRTSADRVRLAPSIISLPVRLEFRGPVPTHIAAPTLQNLAFIPARSQRADRRTKSLSIIRGCE